MNTHVRMAHIRLKDETADVLHSMKSRGDSYDDVVKRLIAENQRTNRDGSDTAADDRREAEA